MSAEPPEVGRYVLKHRLGEGGMGVVYAAVGPCGEAVAVKLIRPEYAAHPDFRLRFEREATLAGKVSGLCTVRVLDMDVRGARPWLAMAFVPGRTLDSQVQGHGPLSGGVLDAFTLGLAEALVSLHAVRVVHRDLKPSNVILGPEGPVVLDFGIARALDEAGITRTRMVIGSPGWIAPERYAGVPAGIAGDVFAWGAVTAFAATTRRPFGRGDDAAIKLRMEQGKPDLAGVPDRFGHLVAAALQPDPAARPTAPEILHALAELLRPGCAGPLRPGGAAGSETARELVRSLIAERWEEVGEQPAIKVATRIPDRPRARTAPIVTRLPEPAPEPVPPPPPAPSAISSALQAPTETAPVPARRPSPWRRAAAATRRRLGPVAVIRSWIAEPGTEPGYGPRALLAAGTLWGWLLSCFWIAAFTLSTSEPWNSATADAVGTRMGVTAASYVTGLIPLADLGVVLLMVARAEAIRPVFLIGNLASIVLGAGIHWLPVLPNWSLPGSLAGRLTSFGGMWGEWVVLVGFFAMCLQLGIWVRVWIRLGSWSGPQASDAVLHRDRLRRLGGGAR